ncbi:MAG: hypothetical protein JWN73_4255 [Betaproteobacteria bacterium]|nr:hypothetical protein [Betaproteobacteria bacterium]
MCGRYVAPDEAALERYWYYKFDAKFDNSHLPADAFSRVNYNAVVTQTVPVECISPEGVHTILPMRWGMDRIDRATGEIAKGKLNNARVEGYKRTPPFADAWRKGQRGIQLVMGYYEWKVTEDGRKLPYYIRPKDQGETFGLACLWDFDLEGKAILTCAHITMPPNTALASIHDRMPAILRLEDHQAWLKGTPEEAAACVKPYPAELIEFSRVSTRVNSTRANDAGLIEPVKEGEEEEPPQAKAKKEKTPKVKPEKKKKDDGQAGFDF